MIITQQYYDEKVEAYNIAIDALIMHESESDIPDMSQKMRNKLIDKLNKEINAWCDHNYQSIVKPNEYSVGSETKK